MILIAPFTHGHGQRNQDYVLSSIVELDDAYFGAPKSNGKQGRGTEKTSAQAAVSLTERGHPCFLKIQVSKLDAKSVSAVAQQTICPDSEIHSDALGPFRATLREGYDHHFQIFDQDSGTLRWVHTLISNVKYFLLGTYHGLGKKHLQSYSMNLPFTSTAASGLSSFSPNLSAPWLHPTFWAMKT